jgi:hypothetical protein
MHKWKLFGLCLLVTLPLPASAAPLTEGVLGRFVGNWTVSGTTRGEPTTTGAQVRPQFGGAFLELHIKDPAGKVPYEARVFFAETKDGSIVAHWLDATGGETSRTLGTGRIVKNRVELIFPYPGSDFRNRLEYEPLSDRWRMLIQMGPKDKPRTFSDWYFKRTKVR